MFHAMPWLPYLQNTKCFESFTQSSWYFYQCTSTLVLQWPERNERRKCGRKSNHADPYTKQCVHLLFMQVLWELQADAEDEGEDKQEGEAVVTELLVRASGCRVVTCGSSIRDSPLLSPLLCGCRQEHNHKCPPPKKLSLGNAALGAPMLTILKQE